MADGPAAKRVLVLEDEWLIAEHIEATLSSLGCTVVGPTPHPADALKWIETDPPDAAILDISLGAHDSFTVAQALKVRRIPFTFLTGYEEDDLPSAFRAYPLIRKPVTEADLITGIAPMLQSPRPPRPALRVVA